jgi:hypothetical protein
MNALQARNNPAAAQPYIDFKRSQAVLEANADLQQLKRPAVTVASDDAVEQPLDYFLLVTHSFRFHLMFTTEVTFFLISINKTRNT